MQNIHLLKTVRTEASTPQFTLLIKQAGREIEEVSWSCKYVSVHWASWIQIMAFILYNAKPCTPSIGNNDAGVTRCLYSGYQLMFNENVVVLDKKSSDLLAAIIGSSFALVVFLARDYLPCIFTSVPWVYYPVRRHCCSKVIKSLYLCPF